MSQTNPEPGAHARNQTFATTHWTTVVTAGDATATGAREALEKLCLTYWYPLYAFVRRKGYSAEESEDLTQSFFGRFLETGALGGVAPEKMFASGQYLNAPKRK